MHLEHCSSGGASVLPHSALPHASAAAPAAGVAAEAAFLDISAQGGCAQPRGAARTFPSRDSTLQPPEPSSSTERGRRLDPHPEFAPWARDVAAMASPQGVSLPLR